MKNIFIIILIFSTFIGFAQQRKYFYVELSDISKIPVVKNNNDGTIKLITNDNDWICK